MAIDPLTTAVLANIEHEIAVGLGVLHADATAIAAAAWPNTTPNSAQCRLRAMRRGQRLSLANITALASALVASCDDITSTETDAARKALSAGV